MALKQRLTFYLDDIDSLCTQIKLTLKWMGSTIINNQIYPPSQFIEILNINQLIGNQNILTGDNFVLKIQQGIQYDPNSPIVFSNLQTINFSAVVPATPSAPATPTIVAKTQKDTNGKIIVIFTIDNIDANATNYSIISELHDGMGNILVQGMPKTFNVIPNKPFTIVSSVLFGQNILLQVGQIILFNISTSIYLAQNQSDDPIDIKNYLEGDSRIINYTIVDPVPPDPDALTSSDPPDISYYIGPDEGGEGGK